jgi:hypothetical protein
MDAAPFVCNMNALSSEQRTQHRELEQLLRSALLATRELNHGYDFQLRPVPEIHEALARITPLERACCPFFTINIRVEQTGELFWRLTGSEGVKQFIRMEFREWFRGLGSPDDPIPPPLL